MAEILMTVRGYEFSGNGIVFADRKEKPAMQEVKYYYGLQK